MTQSDYLLGLSQVYFGGLMVAGFFFLIIMSMRAERAGFDGSAVFYALAAVAGFALMGWLTYLTLSLPPT